MKIKSIFMALLSFVAVFFISCETEDSITPISISFEGTDAGISVDEPTEVTIVFSRTTDQAGTLNLVLESGNLEYGASEDYYTEPSSTEGQLLLDFGAGIESVSFTIFPGQSLNIQQDELLEISFGEEVSSLFNLGVNQTLSVIFSENFVATGGVIEMNAGGESFTDVAYVDLSKNLMTTTNVDAWDLGFYNGSGEFRVILNSSGYVMARPLETSDLSAVSSDDTVGFAFEMTVPPPNFDHSIGSVAWIDTPDGNLETTAFGEISSSGSDNLVYIVKSASGAWKKVKVTAEGNNYLLEYGDISAENSESVTIEKNEAYNFTFFDLENGEVLVEPEKDRWDFKYGTYTEILNLGAPGLDIPYGFKDYIVINRNDVEVSMVMLEDMAYENISVVDASALAYDSKVNAIGSTWRAGGGPGQAPSIYEDRFFVIKDPDGNFYKVQFTRLTSTSGERGYPEFKFERIQS